MVHLGLRTHSSTLSPGFLVSISYLLHFCAWGKVLSALDLAIILLSLKQTVQCALSTSQKVSPVPRDTVYDLIPPVSTLALTLFLRVVHRAAPAALPRSSLEMQIHGPCHPLSNNIPRVHVHRSIWEACMLWRMSQPLKIWAISQDSPVLSVSFHTVSS